MSKKEDDNKVSMKAPKCCGCSKTTGTWRLHKLSEREYICDECLEGVGALIRSLGDTLWNWLTTAPAQPRDPFAGRKLEPPQRLVDVYEWKGNKRVIRGPAIFHGWGVDTVAKDRGIFQFTAAIVEDSDGEVDLVPASMIRFVKTPE